MSWNDNTPDRELDPPEKILEDPMDHDDPMLDEEIKKRVREMRREEMREALLDIAQSATDRNQ